MPAHDTTGPPAAQDEIKYRPVPDYPGYRVGSDGSVWTCKKRVPHTPQQTGGWVTDVSDAGWKRLTVSTTSRRYLSVTISHNDRDKRVDIHVLVLSVFVGPRPPGMQACHWDGDRANNRLSNLRWDTPAANAADSIRHGRTTRGQKNHSAKLTEEQVRGIRAALRAGVRQKSLAQLYGVHKATIWEILKGRIWAHVED